MFPVYAFLLLLSLSLHQQHSRKSETKISGLEEQSQRLASRIQEMQSSMQKEAVEAAKAVARQAA